MSNIITSSTMQLGTAQVSGQRKVRRSDMVQKLLQLGPKPYVFDDGGKEWRSWLQPIFDTPHRKNLFYTGRQISKSTSQAAIMLADSALIPYFKTTYVSPTQSQTMRFSKQRLGALIKDSKLFSKAFCSRELVNQVFNREFKTGAHIALGSAFHDADSMRGVSSDRLALDEIQDIMTESIKVLEQTVSASPHRYFLYSGTPKTRSHAIDRYWGSSTQNCWAAKCLACNKWNMPLGEANLLPEGLSCSKCRKILDPRNGQWVCRFPEATWQGWHISQLMCPWIPWREIWDNYDGPSAYPRSTFFNEVLGFSYDIGQSPITQEEVMACCRPGLSLQNRTLRYPEVYAGLDWAMQNPDISVSPSYTILTMLVVHQDRYEVVFVKRYSGLESDPEYQIQDIAEQCQRAGVTRLFCDWGVGHRENIRLRNILGDQVVTEVRYTNQGMKLRWDDDRLCYNVSRTRIMQDLFEDIKQGRFLFPQWEETATYAKDILSVFVDYGNRVMRETRFDHSPDNPDDWLHSLIYASIALKERWGYLDPA